MVGLDLAHHATEEPRNAADDRHRRLQGRVVAPPTCAIHPALVDRRLVPADRQGWRTGNDEWPLISADGDTAPPSGRDTSGKEIPRHFYEDPSCKDRLAEFNRGPAENDPSRPRVTAGAVLIIALLLPVCADVGSA